MELSYASGTSTTPLLGETIGDNLDRTVARFPEREALVSVHQDLRYTYARARRGGRPRARAFIAPGIEPGDRVGIWSPNCAEWVLVQYATAKAGIILVNVNPAYRTPELAVRAEPVRLPDARRRHGVQDERLRRDGRRGPRRAARRSSGSCSSARDWDELVAGGERVSPDELRERQDATQFDDPINIQYTSGTTGLPEGRDAQPPQHPQQRLLRRRGCRYTEQRPGLHPGALLPLLRHGHGQPRRAPPHGACMVIPAPAFEPARRCSACRTSAARRSTACRRCSSPSSSTRASASSTSRRCARGSWPARRARSR